MNQIPNDPSLSGSIVLEQGTSFLARQIMAHMKVYALMTGRKHLHYSHAETLLWDYGCGCLKTVGAREDGTAISRASEYYGKHEILILKPKVELSAEENAKLWGYYKQVKSNPYQFGNFLAWITWLKLPFIGWTGKKGEKRTYCYELSARFANATGRWPEGKSLDMVSVYDLYECQNYEIYTPTAPERVG